MLLCEGIFAQISDIRDKTKMFAALRNSKKPKSHLQKKSYGLWSIISATF